MVTCLRAQDAGCTLPPPSPLISTINQQTSFTAQYLRQPSPLPLFPPEHQAKACALSVGQLLVELDHDDELTPDALELLKDALLANPDAGET